MISGRAPAHRVARPLTRLRLMTPFRCSFAPGRLSRLGPEIQYTGEKPADPVTLYVYAGADGRFTLYEDDGLTYDYEHGAFARIPILWDEARSTLTIGKREGKFKGMLKERTFNVVLVTPDKPDGFLSMPSPEQTVKYNGKLLRIKLD